MNRPQTVKMLVRLPCDVKEWLERQAERNLSPQSSEVVRALRCKMESEKQPEKAAG
jgi:Arc/MetJ-type ribon-helix-helix transcriptional regulator